MVAQDPRRRSRRGWLAAVVALTVAAIAVFSLSQPTPAPAGAVLGLVGEPQAAAANAGAWESSIRPSSSPPSPIVEPALVASLRGRREVRVIQPKPGIVARATAVAKAVFLGDSYTTGWNGAGLGVRGWPRIVGRAKGWHTVNLAVAGTGFINPGWTKQPVGTRVAAAIRQKPDIVFVAAGHNDSHWSAAAIDKAADKVIDRLHRALPDAVLVVIAPIWPTGSPPARCLDLRNHLRQKAASVGAIFIDPLAGRWFAGSSRRLIGPDGIHPTDAGHRHIAALVLARLAGAA